MQSKIEEVGKENTGLRKCVEELKEQIQALRQMYSNDDFEDGKKIKRMEREIKVLKEEKEKMRKEIDEMRTEKNKKDQITKNEQKTTERKMARIVEANRREREEFFPPLPVPGPSDITWTPAKAREPAEEYEEESERECRVERWDYVGVRRAGGSREEEDNIRMEEDEGRRIGYERQQRYRMDRKEGIKTGVRGEGQYKQMGRRNSEREREINRERGETEVPEKEEGGSDSDPQVRTNRIICGHPKKSKEQY